MKRPSGDSGNTSFVLGMLCSFTKFFFLVCFFACKQCLTHPTLPKKKVFYINSLFPDNRNLLLKTLKLVRLSMEIFLKTMSILPFLT